MPRTNLGRLLIAVLFILALESSLCAVIPVQWVALGSGFLGSIALIIPPLRVEYWKASRTSVQQLAPTSFDLQRSQDHLYNRFTRRIDQWEFLDTSLMIIGGVLLAWHFILQIPYERELIHRDELFQEFQKFKTEQIDPLNDQLRN
jgi:hypothetical protein